MFAYDLHKLVYIGIWHLVSVFWFTGKLDKGAVLKAICAGFEETTEPAVCLSEGW